MDRPPDSDLHHEFFKAKHTTRYLENYLDSHCYAGRSLRNRIELGFCVESITKRDDEWLVIGNRAQYRTPRIIVANGLFSCANIPKFAGYDTFKGPIIHQEAFGQSSVLTSSELHKVTVIGGGKSAADMVYACAKAGKSVTWVIRASGTGPGFLMSPEGKGPYKNAFELGSTRVAGTLSPSFIGPDTWWRRFLFGSKAGLKVVNAVWSGADKETREGAQFDSRPNALPGFANLKPHSPLFWENGSGGLLTRPDFWETIAPNVQVYLEDITHLQATHVCLQSGTEISTDVLLCGTGWKPTSFDFFSADELARLGLPHRLEDEPPETTKLWDQMTQQADREVLDRFPILAEPPEHHHKASQITPYRLYNGIAPLNDSTIAFVGYFNVGNFFKGAECQAIWATAYLDGNLQLPSIDSRQLTIARHIAWCKRRYLSNGELGNFLLFESNFYLDELLQEVGLASHLGGWFTNWFKPGLARDLAGLRDEYMTKIWQSELDTKRMNFYFVRPYMLGGWK
ncbi:MAG: hypothetical protein LQ349_005070 [Xanthoria aureola]|nr:MAG: hypothetical protein LQ349_005070 [Xanthoria aureola]